VALKIKEKATWIQSYISLVAVIGPLFSEAKVRIVELSSVDELVKDPLDVMSVIHAVFTVESIRRRATKKVSVYGGAILMQCPSM
jgi:hypothetical protein